MSEKLRTPLVSSPSPYGLFSCAAVAAPPSPAYPGAPVPAKVLITPAGETIRMRSFRLSATYRLPCPSTATPLGNFSLADVAAPPSMAGPHPPPTTVEILPPGATFRTRWLYASDRYRLPAVSMVSDSINPRDAAAAGPLSQIGRASCRE